MVYTVDGFIFVGSNFRGLNENDTFMGFKICGNSIFLHNSYRKSLIRGYWNSWISLSTKTKKIGTQRKLSHPQYNKSAPFFSDLKNIPKTKNNSRFYILKLFFSLHDKWFSCPVTSLLNISLQSCCILFKIRENQCFWPNWSLRLLS